MGPRMAKGISKRSQTPGNLWNIGFQGTLVMIFINNSDDIFWLSVGLIGDSWIICLDE